MNLKITASSVMIKDLCTRLFKKKKKNSIKCVKKTMCDSLHVLHVTIYLLL